MWKAVVAAAVLVAMDLGLGYLVLNEMVNGSMLWAIGGVILFVLIALVAVALLLGILQERKTNEPPKFN